MYIQLAVLADAANVTIQDKLNILGVFDTILIETTPCRLPDLCLTIRFVVEAKDVGEHELSIRVRNSERKTVERYENTLTVHPMSEGETGHVNYVVPVQGLVVQEEGEHSFDVRWNGRIIASVPLGIVLEHQDVRRDEGHDGEDDNDNERAASGRWFD